MPVVQQLLCRTRRLLCCRPIGDDSYAHLQEVPARLAADLRSPGKQTRRRNLVKLTCMEALMDTLKWPLLLRVLV